MNLSDLIAHIGVVLHQEGDIQVYINNAGTIARFEVMQCELESGEGVETALIVDSFDYPTIGTSRT